MILKIRDRNKDGWAIHEIQDSLHFGTARDGRVRWNCANERWEIRGEYDAKFKKFEREPIDYWHRPNLEASEGDTDLAWVDVNWASGHSSKGVWLFFVFNEAFLLNDAGQNIERIR